jgi:hypothetical protein
VSALRGVEPGTGRRSIGLLICSRKRAPLGIQILTPMPLRKRSGNHLFAVGEISCHHRIFMRCIDKSRDGRCRKASSGVYATQQAPLAEPPPAAQSKLCISVMQASA